MSIITIDSVRMNKELIDLKVFGSKGPTKSELLHKLAQAEERLEAALAELHAMRDSRDTALVEVQSLQKRCEMLEERRDSIRTELELAGHLPNGPGDNEQEDPMDVDPPEEAEARPATPPPQPSSPSAPQPFLRIPT
ncbi:hypothetical protein GY45DRAFT_679773 [Cubamyces sp. BRFM 1775]|nr:hypothetical protein GY45DRAFT_679773 [Cubamyces sp. BRFM 1775]